MSGGRVTLSKQRAVDGDRPGDAWRRGPTSEKSGRDARRRPKSVGFQDPASPVSELDDHSNAGGALSLQAMAR